jgi:threonine dehydrogenase-like Zn-dependent dehydrogenase
MRGAVLYGPRDVRFEERDDPKMSEPTDAIIRITATCMCGSDLWPYRGIEPITQPTPMGHEYCGIVEEVGSEVHLHGGPAPVRRYLPALLDLIWNGKITPGKVFDLTLPLDQVAEGYRAMDERRAIKTLLRP